MLLRLIRQDHVLVSLELPVPSNIGDIILQNISDTEEIKCADMIFIPEADLSCKLNGEEVALVQNGSYFHTIGRGGPLEFTVQPICISVNTFSVPNGF